MRSGGGHQSGSGCLLDVVIAVFGTILHTMTMVMGKSIQ